MAPPPFRKLNFSDDRLLAAFQDNVERSLDFLLNQPGSDKRFLEDTGNGLKQGIALLAASTTTVAHGLGRALRAWRVVDLQADARVWRDATTTAATDRFLALKCSADCTVKLEVW